MLAQAGGEDVAAATLAVLWSAGSLGEGLTPDRPSATGPLATLLHEPYAALGSADPELDASLAAHAAVGELSDHLWARVRPTRAETERVVAVCLAVPTAG